MTGSPTDIALAFFAHWGANRIDAAIAMLSEGVVYDNVPMPTVTGREAVRKFHRDSGLGSRFTVDWEVTHIAAAGNVVLNERVDRFIFRNGGRIVLPVMGTLTIVDGAITLWRDYFDAATFDRQMAAIPPG